MSPTASPFEFPNALDHEGDHQMIDPSSLRLPDSIHGSSAASDHGSGSITPQPTHVDNSVSTSSFWTNAAADMSGSSQPPNPSMSSPWTFDNLNNPSTSTTPSVDAQSESGVLSMHTTPSSSSAKFNFPQSTPSRPSAISNNMMFRSANELVQTPSTAASTPWPSTASTSAMDHTFMPPPPPNTASQSMAAPQGHSGIQGGMQGNHHHHMSLSGAFTGLSPMLAGFSTSSPTFDQSIQFTPGSGSLVGSPINSQLNRPNGPIRTFSASAAIPQTNRKRSNTLMTLASSSPSSSSGPHSYPYPSPRFPTSLMNHHVHPGILPQSASRLNRQPSAPIMTAEPKRVFHPSPATAISPAIGADMGQMSPEDGYNGRLGTTMMGLGMPMGYNSMPMGMMGMGMRSTPSMEAKPPRFKPTKEQLDILIKSYEENKNPDGPAREALAKKLGPDVRPKTLQIWFQNRRSKSRAKERDANLPKPLHTRGGSSSHGHRSSSTASASKGGGNKGVDMEALRGLIHDDDPNLTILPISVLSIANWTRFLMPGSGISHPDLAAAVRFTHSTHPSLYAYVVHQTDTFRIEIPINPSAISNLQSVENPSLNSEAVAISFELSMNTAKYAAWNEDEHTDHGVWNEVGDFTGGETQGGGKCELTGDKEVLLAAFSRVHQYLASGTDSSLSDNIDTTKTSIPGNLWRFPSISSSSPFPFSTSSIQISPFEHPVLNHLQTSHLQKQQAFSQPDLKSSSPSESVDSGSLSEFEFTSKALNFSQNESHIQQTSGQVPLPSTATTSAITGSFDSKNDFGYGWNNNITSPNQLNGSSNNTSQPTIGQNTPFTNWGFPSMNSNSNPTLTPIENTTNTNILHTPVFSTLDPSTIIEGTNNFNQFQTLNSGFNGNMTSNKTTTNVEGFTMTRGEEGDQSECSSEMDLSTPPFEFEEDKLSSNDIIGTTKIGEEDGMKRTNNVTFGMDSNPRIDL
ncbi:uncharacterized protein I206_100682 [Kwoniella pini CBS 10737]|uniref:Homeobox domain-containing protein n=1 Tax=Kwoniella pini CBS 10737 TaxID=1296096 RepID=A0A1B9ID53_9TREE|nr:uncharacterized protein I206_00643 [Kwoniella pini CBS 10737]OCF53341.1 hypothetical protein I206_00643 [Kwoniella pini CBS 10737]